MSEKSARDWMDETAMQLIEKVIDSKRKFEVGRAVAEIDAAFMPVIVVKVQKQRFVLIPDFAREIATVAAGMAKEQTLPLNRAERERLWLLAGLLVQQSDFCDRAAPPGAIRQ